MRTRTPTSTTDPEAALPAIGADGSPLSEVLPMVDAALRDMVRRGLVDSVEVVDLLLDIRSRIVLEHELAEITDPNRSTNGV